MIPPPELEDQIHPPGPPSWKKKSFPTPGIEFFEVLFYNNVERTPVLWLTLHCLTILSDIIQNENNLKFKSKLAENWRNKSKNSSEKME